MLFISYVIVIIEFFKKYSMDRLLFSAPFKAVFTNLGTTGRLLYSKTPTGANAPWDSLLHRCPLCTGVVI